jgi:hypothetical protein
MSETLPPLNLLLQTVLFAETSQVTLLSFLVVVRSPSHWVCCMMCQGSGGSSLDSLDFDVLRGIARSHEVLLACADRARAILLANGGPHLTSGSPPNQTKRKSSFEMLLSDKSLVLSDWAENLASNNLSEDELQQVLAGCYKQE